ncbi:pyrimidine dimer DNA glycosylase/endonuclease V [Corynebacterium kalidii]|uniref:Pyrimidine dimer DNA glycosylase/endonuclease V n=1 Tax=Corynebacterium kalidii TaxID=2931982 RepID=A0A9X1WFQ4_9CORY|nr:pyrimidine dimer DNA glycosylase/endonuclease V [Corynebacterium kalidii]MCJ7857810.1 pyrimidine dimer DNA glycosylase/endonuclease V [Corynebacterium kalidii]
MRLWSLHPSVLDRAALVACWREALLAQKVLEGGTRGYRSHPQLLRFRDHPAPVEAVGAFLTGLHREATDRGYSFDRSRIHEQVGPGDVPSIEVTDGQLGYELGHLRGKVAHRAEEWLPRLPSDDGPVPAHPLFTVTSGPVEPWEVVPPTGTA